MNKKIRLILSTLALFSFFMVLVALSYEDENRIVALPFAIYVGIYLVWGLIDRVFD